MDNKDIDVVYCLPKPLAFIISYLGLSSRKRCLEKPGSHNIFEGRKMVEVLFNCSAWCSVEKLPINEAIGLLRNGYIGNVYMYEVWFSVEGDIGDKGFSSVPNGLDYDLWTGPAPKRPFTENLVHYNCIGIGIMVTVT